MPGRKKKIHFSKIYTFKCKRAAAKDGHHHIGGPGFSRVVYCNEPTSFEATSRNYVDNYVKTTKYSPATFLPKSLFEQFRRVANFFFLVTAILSFTSIAPYSAASSILPLSIVIGATMLKEGVEDFRRKQQDDEVNGRKVNVHQGDGSFKQCEWKDLRVGDVVKVQKDEFFPADLLLLSSSYDDAICYVETMNLDGETNLKLKQSLEVTSSLHEDSSYKNFKAIVKCEDPNANLYTFVGSMELEEEKLPLSPQQLLLRDSKLRNTEFIYGVVVFTGHETKVIQNSTAPPSKRSNIERKMDRIIYFLFGVLFVIAFVGSLVFGIVTKDDLHGDRMRRWYLRPDNAEIFFDPHRAPEAAIYHFLTALLLYTYLIPISLYVSIEVVKVLQCIFINQDIEMYHEETDKPAHARTSNLNEELGQIHTILSDKTGTLTCNSMEFIKCSIAGTSYGRGVTEVERAMAKRLGSPLIGIKDQKKDMENNNTNPRIKGFNFEDERIANGNWVREPHPLIIQGFLRLLAICHTAIPDMDEDTGNVTYEAESPDEAAFVIAALQLGFEFYQRTQTTVSLIELDPVSHEKVKREYDILNVLEFNSTRKRMSVILRFEGKLLLLCKGADSVMFERLGKNGREFEEDTREHVDEYADAGLRTLILAYRELTEEEYKDFNEKFKAAENSVSADRETMISEATELVERDLVLIGATAVEDKLQQGVPECIDKLAQAGIKIWVLTGDKMETTINIGFACSLLRQGMKQIKITLETPEIKQLEKVGEKGPIAQASKRSVVQQISEGKDLIASSGNEAFALIIDGKSLAYALEDDLKKMFFDLAVVCSSVICCRSSPKQKALVTRLVKEETGKTTLAVGDGANDVGMLQEADIGIGISGVEGMQAVMSSDISIAQFKYLERLLLVHGHWCYRRISSMVMTILGISGFIYRILVLLTANSLHSILSWNQRPRGPAVLPSFPFYERESLSLVEAKQICYFFYKNLAFGFTLFCYEAYASFSGQAAYNDWFLSLYNVFFTSLPVIAMGVFDQDVSARFCLKFPLLYQEGVQNVLFSWRRIIGWMLNGVSAAVIIFFLCIRALEPQAFKKDGKTAGLDVMGPTIYTCVVWVVNCQMAISISYFTLIQHIFIWGGICLWYCFLLAYGAMSPTISTTAYKVFTEALAPSASYWLITLCVVIAALTPYFSYKSLQMRFFPMYHGMIQWIRHDGRSDDSEYCHMVRQRSIRHTTVGIMARSLARTNPFTGSTHRQR